MNKFFKKKFSNSKLWGFSKNNNAPLSPLFDATPNKELEIARAQITTASACKKIYGKTPEAAKFDNSKYNGNINDLVDIITNAKEIDGYISRTISNFKQKSSKTGFKFVCKDEKKADQFQDYLEDILINSGSSTELFFQEILNNFISFGNVFLHKTIDIMTGKISKITVMPSKGWTPLDSYGTQVIKWQFEIGDVNTKYTIKNITHISFDKETHHVMGVPLPANALQDSAILRDIESENIQDYLDSLDKKTIFYVGDHKKPAKQLELDEVADKITSAGASEDLVLSGHVEAKLYQSVYNSHATDIIANMKNRVLAALRSSSTNVGEKGAGRQDADTLDTQEDTVVEDIQTLLENQLNTTIFRELALELFGSVTSQNIVKLKFNETFTKKERREKHEIFKYLSGVTTIDEVRSSLGETQEVDTGRLYSTLTAKEGTTLEGASNATNPANQHGNRGSSAPSKKN